MGLLKPAYFLLLVTDRGSHRAEKQEYVLMYHFKNIQSDSSENENGC